jgi:drug/metabolite transporter (DMT)-like permease
MVVSTMLSMRRAVVLLASSAAVSAQGPSMSDAPALLSLGLRVRHADDAPGLQRLLPLHLGHNQSGPVTAFHPNVSEYTVSVPGFNSTSEAIRSVRLYATANRDSDLERPLPEVRVISYTNPDEFDDGGFDNHDERDALEDPYCAAGEVKPSASDECKQYVPDGHQGGLFFNLNAHEGKRTKFELVACPYDDGEQTCEEQGTTYTLWVFFPDWNQKLAPGAPFSWPWVTGCVLCEISAFLYACGICLQRYGLKLGSEQDSRGKRPSIAGMPGSELKPSVVSHMVTAPPGSVAGKMVPVSVNGREIRVEVPVGVSGGDQFSVPVVDGGVGLSDVSQRSCITIDRANVIWAVGMFMWFVGNSLYTYALNYAPLSLLTALFATVLVFNGLLARFFLQEQVRGSDIVGWMLIMIGISICGCFIDKEVKQFSAHQILVLAGKPAALVYELSVVAMIVGITTSVCVWTSRHPGTVGPFPTAMEFAFPCVLAMYECLIQICLKGISNMVDLTFNGSNQLDQPMFWVIFVLCGLCSIAVMVWMRAGYARFEAVQMLPIQSESPASHRVPLLLLVWHTADEVCVALVPSMLTVATLTTCTVIGGLMFYGE